MGVIFRENAIVQVYFAILVISSAIRCCSGDVAGALLSKTARDLQPVRLLAVPSSVEAVRGISEGAEVEEAGKAGVVKDVDEFTQDDLIATVKALEREAQREEQSGLLPGILEMLDGKFERDDGGVTGITTTEAYGAEERQDREEDDVGILLDDLGELPEDIADDVTAGVEESLLLGGGIGHGNGSETRQFSVYMFQGQYIPEPRLNRFIDGAISNMRTELRISLMDPLYFRVLPRGQVESRAKPVKKIGQGKNEPVVARFFNLKKKKVAKKKRAGKNRNRRKNRPGLNRPNRNRNRNRNRVKVNQGQKNKGVRRPGRGKNKNRNKGKNKRQKRRVRKNVGGGRVEGLSVCERDGDAEMQVFGNYTLIRSHFRMGPVELSMQFRTRQGLRRTGATLPQVKLHTVTRVNMDGSEMIDFLLDRPHPETIEVRGRLFPLAKRIARNIFSKLFVPNSFLTSKLREKASLALRARPKR